MDAMRKMLIALIAILFIGSICGCIDEGAKRMEDFIDAAGEPIKKESDVEDKAEDMKKKLDKMIEESSEGPQMETVSKPVIIEELIALNTIRYDDGEADGFASSSERGHAVHFSNNEKLNLVEIKMFSARYDDGEGNFEIEIWDNNLKTIYSVSYDYTDFFPENYIPLKNSDLKWVTIDVPDVQVNSDFYVVIFTHGERFSWKKENSVYGSSTRKGGIVTGRDSDTKSGNSFMVMKNPNRIIDWETITTWNIRQEDTDWMIRAVDEIK